MDALTSLACLLLGIALPLASLFLLVRRGMRQLAVAEAYGDVSRRLGLPVDTRGVSLHGYVDDQRLWVGTVMVGHGPDREMRCWGVLDLPRPLALGLLIRRRGLSERIFRRGRNASVTLPDTELERLVEVNGDDPRSIQQLLRGPVAAALAELVQRWNDVIVTDHSVRVRLAQPLSATAELQELVDGLRRLAALLTDARLAVPPPAGLQSLAPAYEALADELGLEWVPAYPALQGERDGRAIVVTPRRSPRGYSAEVRVRCRAHRDTGLLVVRQEGPDGYWSVGQDIQVDDAAFDERFVLKGYDPGAVIDLLTPEVREVLLELSSLGELSVDDHHVRVRGLSLEADTLRDVLLLAGRAADGLGW